MTPAETQCTVPSTGNCWLFTLQFAFTLLSNTLSISSKVALFYVLTDHKPLTYVLITRSDRYSPRQARHPDNISQFTSNIRHVHGLDNVVADALLGIVTNVLLSGQPPTVDFAAIAKSQTTDPHIRLLQSSPTSTLAVEAVPLFNTMDPLYCDTFTGTQCPMVLLPW